MKKTRIALSALLALVLALSLALMGCGQTAPSPGPAPETGAASGTEQVATDAPDPVTLQFFAANSLSMALDEVQALYVESHDWVTFSDTQYLASGELVEMLSAGAAADLLITASSSTMDTAVENGDVDGATRFDMFSNDLVMVTSATSGITSVTLEDIATGQYTIAIGDESVPAGVYAAQALYSVGLYSDESGRGGELLGPLAEDGRVILASSVGNVTRHAETGDVDIAFVYSSDVYRFGGVVVAGTVPSDAHKPILYPAGITTDTQNAEEVQAFLDWATSDTNALRLWQEWGFELIA